MQMCTHQWVLSSAPYHLCSCSSYSCSICLAKCVSNLTVITHLQRTSSVQRGIALLHQGWGSRSQVGSPAGGLLHLLGSYYHPGCGRCSQVTPGGTAALL
jgi:hypothetical protein